MLSVVMLSVVAPFKKLAVVSDIFHMAISTDDG
jgi:hypothetical protein